MTSVLDASLASLVPRISSRLLSLTKFVQEIVVENGSIKQYGYPGGEKEGGWTGTYRIFRDTFELLEEGTDEPLAMTWSFDGKQLVLSDMRTEFCDHRTVWTTHPWVLVAEG